MDINNLPQNRNDWLRIINSKYNDLYLNELETFLKKNGRIFVAIFGYDTLHSKYKNKPYSGLFDELKLIFNDNMSTNEICKSIKVLMNFTKLNYSTIDSNSKLVPCSNKGDHLCPFCGLKWRRCASTHLIWFCRVVSKIFQETSSF